MSTRFTKLGTPMTESHSLRLVFGTAGVHQRITEYIANILNERGYARVSPSMLDFLGTLDCGVNHGSDIARRLGVSRQMVAKTVKELCRVGYLEQIEGAGKQKPILFTAAGERLIAEVRELLAGLDEVIGEQIGEAALLEAITTLEAIQALVTKTPRIG